jgi:magnesium chelatase accessory protein
MSDRLNFDRDGRDWPNRASSRFVKAGGIGWHVQVMGTGPVLLLLHGTGASTHSWAKAAPLLAKSFTVVIPDLPGHAFTDTPTADGLTLPGMARMVAALTDTLGLKPALAVGHSAGAAILIRMSLDRLIAPSGIISVNGALLPFGGAASQFFSPLAKMLVLNPLVPRLFAWRAGRLKAVEAVLRGTGSEIDEASLDFYARLFQNSVHIAGTLGMMAGWDLNTFERDLSKLKVPLLLLAGGADLAVKAEDAFKVRDRVTHATVDVITGVGHLAHEERPEDIVRRIEAFGSLLTASKKAG